MSNTQSDLYVEDDRAKVFLTEILTRHAPEVVSRVQIIPFGASNVGQALGQMVIQKRFRRKTLVFLDGDLPSADGCISLPGGDAPERVVFETLQNNRWGIVDLRSGRDLTEIQDACARAMTLGDHHDWVVTAAKALSISADVLWQIFCSTWAETFPKHEAAKIVDLVADALIPSPA